MRTFASPDRERRPCSAAPAQPSVGQRARYAPATVVALQPSGPPPSLQHPIQAMLGVDASGVHCDPVAPARIGALAYAGARDIAPASGERQLPHEAWHIVRQRRGHVGATTAAADRSVSAGVVSVEPPSRTTVVQLVGIEPDSWSDANNVTEMADGVFKVSGPGGVMVFKTAADTENPADEVVGAAIGDFLDANTVMPRYYKTSDVLSRLSRLRDLQPSGAALLAGAQEAGSFLVLPFIEGELAKDAHDDVRNGSETDQYSWGKQLGRLVIADLLTFNADRHGENLKLAGDRKLYAFDQPVGFSGTHGPEFALETFKDRVKRVIADLQGLDKSIPQRLAKIFPELRVLPPRFKQGYRRGMLDALRSMKAFIPDSIQEMYRGMLGSTQTGPWAPGVDIAVRHTKRILQEYKPDASGDQVISLLRALLEEGSASSDTPRKPAEPDESSSSMELGGTQVEGPDEQPRQETSPSGDCLFEAVNIILGNPKGMDDALRQLVTSYALSHLQIMKQAGLDADAVIATLSAQGKWAGDEGDFAPAILASAIGRNIFVHTTDFTTEILSNETIEDNPIHIYLSGQHYTVHPPSGWVEPAEKHTRELPS